MLNSERERIHKLFADRASNAVERCRVLSANPRVISELDYSIDTVANFLLGKCLLTNEFPQILIGGKSANLTKILINECFSRLFTFSSISLEDTVISFGDKDNKRLYEGETYNTESPQQTRNYVLPQSLIEIPKDRPIYIIDDRLRTGEKAQHTRQSLYGFGFGTVGFIVFAAAIRYPDVFTGTTNREVYELLDNLSYLHSRKILLYEMGKIVQDGVYFDFKANKIDDCIKKSFDSVEYLTIKLQEQLHH